MYTAVIIEPRPHKALPFVLNNILTNLSEKWNVLIFHGTHNSEFIENIITSELSTFKNRILQPISLHVDNLTIKQYNKILMTTAFYHCIPTDIFLIFQTDTIILHQNRHLLDDFLIYDYVGAPWRNGYVGNGGFSLRRKSKMIEICEKVPRFNYLFNEDVYFACQKVIELYKPHWKKAMQFSIETLFHERSFAIHAAWKYLNKYEINFLRNKYSEFSILMDLHTVDLHTVDSHTVDSHTVDLHTVDSHTVDSHTVDSHTVECNNSLI